MQLTHDKQDVLTEWGNYYVYENDKNFSEHQGKKCYNISSIKKI